MAQQKCKACGKSIDIGLVICPSCGSPPTKEREQGLSPVQIKQIAKRIRKELAVSAFTLLSVLSLIFGIGLWQAYREATKQLQDLLVQRISNEFEQPIIRQTVQEVAAKNAKDILEKEIQPEVVKFKTEIGSDLKEIQALVKTAQARLDDLTTLIELDDAASYGSRAALTQLIEFSRRNDSLGVMANRRIKTILRDLSIIQFVPTVYFSLVFTVAGKKINATKLSTHDLFLYLDNPQTPREHVPSLMAHISAKPKAEVCKEAIRVIKSSDSLIGSTATLVILNKLFGQDLNTDELLKACNDLIQKGKKSIRPVNEGYHTQKEVIQQKK